MKQEPIWIRKQKALEPSVRLRLPLIVESTGDGVFLFSERYAGVCVCAETTENAVAQIDDAVNAYRTWAGETAETEPYIPVVIEQYETDAQSPEDSRIIFTSERAAFPAKTHTRLKNEAIASALSFTELYNALPDPDLPLNGYSGRETLRERNALHATYAAKLGVDYTVGGELYADRKAVIRAIEQPGYMRNVVYPCADGEWSYRKFLRRLILADRLAAYRLYTAAVNEWGKCSNPFRF